MSATMTASAAENALGGKSMNNMLTLEEVKSYLDVEQKELEDYLARGKLHAYKIGGTYLRFRKEDVINLRYQIQSPRLKSPVPQTLVSTAGDFWRFNNFYILSILIVIGAVYWLLKF